MSEIHQPHVINNVLDAAVSLETAVRAVSHPPRELWQGLHDALLAVERCHDLVLAHYQWTDRVKGKAINWPWQWPDVPPISPALLDGLEKSASSLRTFAHEWAGRREPSPAATDSNDTLPTCASSPSTDAAPANRESPNFWARYGDEVNQSILATEQRIRALLTRLGTPPNVGTPAALLGFFAAEFGWGPERVAGLDDYQMQIYLREALRRREAGLAAASSPPSGRRPFEPGSDAAPRADATDVVHSASVASEAADGGTPRAIEEEPKEPADGDSQPHADGLEGGRWLWWQNRRYDIPQGNVYKMLAVMWGRDSASYDDLLGTVFDDPVQPQTIRSYANKVNNALPAGFPWRLSTDSVSRQLTKVARAPGK
jgi:hypothetical protein